MVPRRYRQPNYSADTGYSAPPGKNAPAEVRQAWQEAFEKAEAYYVSQHAPDPEVIASNTAWKTINLDWKPGGRGKLLRRNPQELVLGKTHRGKVVHLGDAPRTAPSPGKVTRLGKVIEIAWVDPQRNGAPHLHVQRFREPGLPDLAWNEELRTLMFFPNTEMPEELSRNLKGLESQTKMFKRWAKGRAPTGHSRVRTPATNIHPVGVADTLVYRSDKFSGKHNPHPDLSGSQEFVHQFDDDVFVEQSASSSGKPPGVVVIQGGKLDVKSAGIIH